MKFEDFKEVDPDSIEASAYYRKRTNISILDKIDKAGTGKAYVLECKDLADAVKKAQSLGGSLNQQQNKGKYLGIKLFRRMNMIYLVNDADKWQ